MTFVERRWLEWGFKGVPVPDPWAGHVDGRCYVAPGESLADLLGEFGRQAARSDAIIARHGLDEVGAPGER